VVTTHHNLLKEFAFRSENAENASTVFDIETLEPVFKLRTGTAGRSYALEIAERLGLDKKVVERAREVVGSGGAKVDELLGRLGEEIDRRETARRNVEETASRMESARLRQASRQEKYREQVRDIREKTRKDARAVLREIENRGREIIRDLPVKDRESARRSLKKGLKEIREDIGRRIPPVRQRSAGGVVSEGDEVRILPLGIAGTVEALYADRKEAEIVSGGIRMRVPVVELERCAEKSHGSGSSRKGTPVVYSGTNEERVEINLLGKTVPEALDSVDRFIDRSLMGSHQTLRIIHGRGTGALKKAINDLLREDPRVFSYGPAPMNEGGEGVTVVELKE
jgi:DNA mismatch repair protein MutS2